MKKLHSKKENVKKRFLRFLKETNTYKPFFENFKDPHNTWSSSYYCHGDLNEYINQTFRYSLVSSAFSFYASTEGSSFWGCVDALWYELCEIRVKDTLNGKGKCRLDSINMLANELRGYESLNQRHE